MTKELSPDDERVRISQLIKEVPDSELQKTIFDIVDQRFTLKIGLSVSENSYHEKELTCTVSLSTYSEGTVLNNFSTGLDYNKLTIVSIREFFNKG